MGPPGTVLPVGTTAQLNLVCTVHSCPHWEKWEEGRQLCGHPAPLPQAMAFPGYSTAGAVGHGPPPTPGKQLTKEKGGEADIHWTQG